MGLLDQFSGILQQGEDHQPARRMRSSIISRSQRRPLLPHFPGQSGDFSLSQMSTFGQNIASMFGRSNPGQQAGILNTLLESGGGAGILSKLGFDSDTTQISPQQAQQVSPAAVEEASNHAQGHDPSIIDRASDFYSQHPTLVQALGAGAALVALQHLSRG